MKILSMNLTLFFILSIIFYTFEITEAKSLSCMKRCLVKFELCESKATKHLSSSSWQAIKAKYDCIVRIGHVCKRNECQNNIKNLNSEKSKVITNLNQVIKKIWNSSNQLKAM